MSSKELQELMNTIDDVSLVDEEIDETLVPNKCLECLNNPICHGLTTILGLTKIGIKVQVDRCRYFRKDIHVQSE